MTEVKDDEAILNFIFDPKRAFIGASVSPPAEERPSSPEPMSGEAEAKVLEKQAVAKAEAGDHDEALALFERAAEACPESGSVMNNTAQLHRLKGDADSARSAVDRAVELELAWVAAHEATDRIALTGTWKVHKTTLQKALTQRAVMRRESGDTDGADADMAAAAAHGSALARAITTGTNPYATMCHAAVSTMMGPKEGEGAAE